MTAGAKSCTYCIYIFCHANCCYFFFLCFFLSTFSFASFIQKYSKCTRDFIRHKYCNLSDISGDETLSEMKLVCPIVQDFYFPKLKICYKKKKSSCLPSYFHECSLSFNGIIISGGIFAISICHNIVKQTISARYFFQQGSYTTLLEGFHTHKHAEAE